MTENVKALPRGLTLYRAGESLEAAGSKTGDVHLLFARGKVELVRTHVKAGKHITLVPPPDKNTPAPEIYFVLGGSLRCDLPAGSFRVGPGDHLVAENLEQPTIFVAETDTWFLYLTLQPFFHHISSELGELMRLAEEVKQKDGYTANHCQRIQSVSYRTGKLLNLSHDRLHYLEYGAYLHDVGKVETPISILNKPAALTPGEWEVVKRHPLKGKEMVETTFMKPAGRIIEQHHERLDGSGYPYGLKGGDILTEAYIVAVADVYDAMTSDRPYREALSHKQATYEIRRYAGQHYPGNVVEAFFAALAELEM